MIDIHWFFSVFGFVQFRLRLVFGVSFVDFGKGEMGKREVGEKKVTLLFVGQSGHLLFGGSGDPGIVTSVCRSFLLSFS